MLGVLSISEGFKRVFVPWHAAAVVGRAGSSAIEAPNHLAVIPRISISGVGSEGRAIAS
jgi:hypothetical protein